MKNNINPVFAVVALKVESRDCKTLKEFATCWEIQRDNSEGLGRPPEHNQIESTKLQLSRVVLELIQEVPGLRKDRTKIYAGKNGQRSSDQALDSACFALASHEIDHAVVAAIDYSRNSLDASQVKYDDMAVALVIKRYEDFEDTTDTIIALIEKGESNSSYKISNQLGLSPLEKMFANSLATSGLLHLAAACLMVQSRVFRSGPKGRSEPLLPTGDDYTIGVTNYDFSANQQSWIVKSPLEQRPISYISKPTIQIFSGQTIDQLKENIKDGNESLSEGNYRLACIVKSAQEGVDVRIKLLTFLNEDTEEGWLSDRVVFRKQPLNGDMAFVYTGGATTYGRMGKDLLLGFPELINSEMDHDLQGTIRWLYQSSSSKFSSPFHLSLASGFLSLLHSSFSLGHLKLKPHAAIGFCNGESFALFAHGVWHDFGRYCREVEQSPLFSKILAGEYQGAKNFWKSSQVQWQTWSISAPIEQVEKLLKKDSRVYMAYIITPRECTIMGDANACRKIVDQIGEDYCRLSNYNAILHCPPAESAKEMWKDLHTRECRQAPLKVYSTFLGNDYSATRENVAEALTNQAMHPIDFPRIIKKAWDDGVRIFVEHGPLNAMSQSISEILKGKPHLVVSFDKALVSSIDQTALVAAELWCAGVSIDLTPFKPKHRRCVVDKPLPRFVTQRQVQSLEGQIQLLTEGHLHYLSSQLQGKKAYDGLMLEIQRQLMGNAQLVDLPIEPAELLNIHSISRAQLEVLASGRISSILGSSFAKQDDFKLRTRIPEPPLLLIDRVTDFSGKPCSLGDGTIQSESDLRIESWHLHQGRIPFGILIESAQAIVLLLSLLGVDLQNQGMRSFRLLGKTILSHGKHPVPGSTLKYEICIDDYVNIGNKRVVFFHYKCDVDGQTVFSSKGCQAGFFTGDELLGTTGGVWDHAQIQYTSGVHNFTPNISIKKRCFSTQEVRAYSEGNLMACFGQEFLLALTHTRSPHSPSGLQHFVDDVTHFDPTGGPAGRGYLRATCHVYSGRWFCQGHFKNDPCMPGSLQMQASCDLLGFFLSALGVSLDKDGWVFELVPDNPSHLQWRGQVTPSSREVVYELFVDQVINESYPTIFAHVIGTVDGVPSFFFERLGVRLIPDFPITSLDIPLSDATRPFAANVEGGIFDYASLLNNALGRAARSMGPNFAMYDDVIPTLHLPGPPYLFMSYISHLNAAPQVEKVGSSVTAVYDLGQNPWCFAENGSPTLPLCVLLEIALQPCGWLVAYVLGNTSLKRLHFRNLDGKGVLHREIIPEDKEILTQVTLAHMSRLAGSIITKFEVICKIGDEPIFELGTTSGFFTPETMKSQEGMLIEAFEAAQVALPSNRLISIEDYLGVGTSQCARLASCKLQVIDRITGFWPTGGEKGLGYLRAEKDVKASDWYFKAHFFQDPVQPSSYGLEGMMQLLRFYMLYRKGCKYVEGAHFEPFQTGCEMEWHCLGQVVPSDSLMTIDLEIIEEGEDEKGAYVKANARLWANGKKICQMPAAGMRLIKRTLEIPMSSYLHVAGSNQSDEMAVFSPKDIEERMLDRQRVTGFGTTYFYDQLVGLMHHRVKTISFADFEQWKSLSKEHVIYVANNLIGQESLLLCTALSVLAKSSIDFELIVSKNEIPEWMEQFVTLIKMRGDVHGFDAPPLALKSIGSDKIEEFAQFLSEYAEKVKARTDILSRRVGLMVKSDKETIDPLMNEAIKKRLLIVPVSLSGTDLQEICIGHPIYPDDLERLPKNRRYAYINETIERLNQGKVEQGEKGVVSDDPALLWQALLCLAHPSPATQEVISYFQEGDPQSKPESSNPFVAILCRFMREQFFCSQS